MIFRSGCSLVKFYVAALDCRKRVIEVTRRLAEYRELISVNPVANLIISPLFMNENLLKFYGGWRCGSVDLGIRLHSVMLDSGGFQVQTGKISFSALCVRLMRIWQVVDWADYYVLPDHVPKSSDADFEVERKIDDTLRAGERFLKLLPKGKQAIGVVHGRNLLQVLRCVRLWRSLGLSYLAFGSFGTSGPNGGINLVSKRSLSLLKAVSDETSSFGMRLHVFGISYPKVLRTLLDYGIKVSSLDSSGWWKAAAFNQVIFDETKPMRFVFYSTGRTKKYVLKVEDIEAEKLRTGHECPFCRDPMSLSDMVNRALHNLIVTLDFIGRNVL